MTTRRSFLGGLAAIPLLHPASSQAQTSCLVPTTPDIEGPYYRAGVADGTSPFEGRGNLILHGTIRNTRCERVAAHVELWQANEDGHYDNDGTTSGHFGRAALSTANEERYLPAGVFAIRTVRPGHYLNGAVYRPAHLHVKVSASGYVPLTTQLYFPGDPYNAHDPFFHRSRLLRIRRDAPAQGGYVRAFFDFILQPLPMR